MSGKPMRRITPYVHHSFRFSPTGGEGRDEGAVAQPGTLTPTLSRVERGRGGERFLRRIFLAVMLVIAAPAAAPAADDPRSIDDVVAQVRAMRERGASNDEIGAYVAGVVDRRVTMGNAAEGDVRRNWDYWTADGSGRTAPNVFDRWNRFEEQRENLGRGQAGFRNTDGREFEHRARWTWENQYGHCEESAATTYFILHEAGVPARIMNAPGHAFTVIGMAEDADPEDISTWGDDARVVDPWQRRDYVSAPVERLFDGDPVDAGGYTLEHALQAGGIWRGVLTPAQARRNRWIGRNGRQRPTDVTDRYDNPRAWEQWQAMTGHGNLTVRVVRESGGTPVDGARVVAMAYGVAFNPAGSTAGGSVKFSRIQAASYTVEAEPLADEGLLPARGTVTVPERGNGNITLTLKDDPRAPVEILVEVRAGQDPVIGSEVTITGEGDGQTETTNGAGFASFTVRPGSWRIAATAPEGYRNGSATLTAKPRHGTDAGGGNVRIGLRPDTASNPGRIVITSPANGTTTREPVITVTGTVENRAITVITLVANGSPRDVAVANGRWTTQVPLIKGANTLQANSGRSSSNAVRITADIARSAIWTELTWGGKADIDLHLYLPNGTHCYYSDKQAGGATLDVDNQEANGPEHITMERALPGQYRLTVVYYSSKGQEPAPAKSWRVTVRLNDGASQQTYSGTLTAVGQEQTVASWRF